MEEDFWQDHLEIANFLPENGLLV